MLDKYAVPPDGFFFECVQEASKRETDSQSLHVGHHRSNQSRHVFQNSLSSSSSSHGSMSYEYEYEKEAEGEGVVGTGSGPSG